MEVELGVYQVGVAELSVSILFSGCSICATIDIGLFC